MRADNSELQKFNKVKIRLSASKILVRGASKNHKSASPRSHAHLPTSEHEKLNLNRDTATAIRI